MLAGMHKVSDDRDEKPFELARQRVQKLFAEMFLRRFPSAMESP
jgi:hypothetical protein